MKTEKSQNEDLGFSWRFVVLVLASIFVVIFGIQNADEVTIRFFRLEGTVSLALVLFIVLFIGAITTAIMSFPAYFRRRKMRNRYESEIRELKIQLQK